jgi:broad specificity phosphatase PhoE
MSLSIRKIMSLMSEFYFVRHGQTDANVQGIMCGGVWDLELNPTGHEQARLASLRFKEQIKEIKTICVSPMIRAQQTAGYFAEHFARPITKVDELREWDFGSWEKVRFESIKQEFFGETDPIGGESRKIFHERIKKALEKCHAFESPTLLVAHGGVGLALMKHLEIDMTHIANCVPHRLYKTHAGIWNFEII